MSATRNRPSFPNYLIASSFTLNWHLLTQKNSFFYNLMKFVKLRSTTYLKFFYTGQINIFHKAASFEDTQLLQLNIGFERNLLDLSEINYQSINISLSLIGGFYTAILSICYAVVKPIVSRVFKARLKEDIGKNYKEKISYEGLSDLHDKIGKLEMVVEKQKKMIE